MTDQMVRFVATEQAVLEPVERDTRPLQSKEVAGRTLVSLISPGTELASGYTASDGFPHGSGYASVFEVEAVGSGVSDIEPGDVVFCMGGHRSYQRMTRESVVPVPEGLAPEKAVFARLMGVSMSTLTTTTARPPGRVIVTGQGIVGNLCAQNFRTCGYDVIAIEPNESRLRISERCGTKALPAMPLDDATLVGKVDLVVDCSGHEQAVLDACQMVRKRGEVVLLATPWRRFTEIYAHTILHAIFHKYVVMRSGWEWEVPLQPTEFRTNSIYGNFAGALRWLLEGRIVVEPLATKIPPREAQTAYQNLLHKRAEGLSYLFDWDGCS